jgi:hypothetical protein
MEQNVGAVERAFQLAKSGKFRSVTEIERQVRVEGYSADQISGRTLLKQLRALLSNKPMNRC